MNENTNQMALVSVISAAIAWIAGLGASCVVTIVFLPLALGTGTIFLVGNIFAVVAGHLARNQIKQSGEEGAQIAMVGLVLGWVGIGLLVLSIVGITSVLIFLVPQIREVYSEISQTAC